MNRFIIKLAFFTLLFFIMIVLLSYKKNYLVDTNDYMAAMIYKHQLLKNIPGPRIIIVGDSNVAFGIDSHEVEKVLNYKVINMGLHIGLGLDFMLNEIKDDIRPDDIIIISIAWFLPETGSPGVQSHAALFYPDAKKYFKQSISEILFFPVLEMQENIKVDFKKLINNKLKKRNFNEEIVTPVYSRRAFNEYGDATAHLDLPSTFKIDYKNDIISYQYYKGIKNLNNFYQYAQSKKANVYFTFPCYPESLYKINKKVIDAYYNDLKKDLIMPIITTPDYLIFPDNYFYDTYYHLNRKGRDIRTKLFIDTLKKNVINKNTNN